METAKDIYTSYREVCEIIRTDPNVSTVIFIDGDSMLHCLFQFNDLLQNVDSPIKIIVSIVRSIHNKQTIPFCGKNWFFMIETSTTDKNAADTMMCLMLGYLDAVLELNVKFMIISRDTFGRAVHQLCMRHVKMNGLPTIKIFKFC